MHEAPKYFRSDFMPREMERLGLAGRPRERERWREESEEVREKEGWSRCLEKGRAKGARAVDTSTRARHAWLVKEAPTSQLDG